jgi:predicted metal-binding protein
MGCPVTESCPRLIVCTTCRAGQPLADGEAPQGAQLHAELQRLLGDAPGPAPALLQPATCLANCERGCSAAITMPGKWTNLLGYLSPALAGDLLVYARAYAASATGTVMPSRRPATLQRLVVGRVPPLEQAA